MVAAAAVRIEMWLHAGFGFATHGLGGDAFQPLATCDPRSL